MRFLFCLCFALFSGFLTAQDLVFDRMLWDFGDVAYWKNDTAYFKLRNATARDLSFLPTFYNEDYKVLISDKKLEPGEAADIGIVYYTENKGRFNVEVPLYVSVRPDPIIFKLKGNIKGFDPDALLRCPVVNAGSEENRLEKLVDLEVRDRQTDELLRPDEIWVKTAEHARVKLEKWGVGFRMSVVSGVYRVSAAKSGYDDYIALIKLEPYQRKFIVYMDKNPDLVPVETPWLDIDSLPLPITIMDIDTAVREKERNTAIDTLSLVGDGRLDLRQYRRNNIIFILDVSMSMKRDNKLDNLKSSISILLDALRPEDKLGIIGFSSQAVLIQNPEPVAEKDSIKARLNRMKATGGTNGGAALKMAYALAEEHFIVGGNNQIIIATDGLFGGGDLSRKDMEKLIVTGNGKGIHLSTLGFGFDPKALDFLKHLSDLGGGNHLNPMLEARGEQALLEMVKNQSKLP